MTDPDEPTDLVLIHGAEQTLHLDHIENKKALVLVSRLPPSRHPAAVYLARLAPGSRRSTRYALDLMADLLSPGTTAENLDWGLLRYQHTAALRAALSEKYAHASVNKFLSALRGVLKEAWRLGYLPIEDYHRAADLPAVRGYTLPRGRALSMGELRALFKACAHDKKLAGVRDAAILAVLYGAGLRRSELVDLDLDDYNPAEEELRVRRGKGRKARLTYTPAGCLRGLDRWIARRGSEPGPLFLPITRGGRLLPHRLTDQAVLFILEKRAREAGVGKFSPHDLRRTFIGDLLEAGADIATVQQLAGHANVQTTARYDRRGVATRRRAAGLLNVPIVEEEE